MACTTCADECVCSVTDDGSIDVTGSGTGPDPFVISYNDLCDDSLECIAPLLDTQGFTFNGTQFENGGASGSVLTADGAGGAQFLPLPTPSCEDVQDCVGSMMDSQGFVYDDGISGFRNTGDSQAVLTSDGLGGASFTPRGRKLADGRLTVVSGDPVPNTGSGTTVYYTPYIGNKISLFSGTAWIKYVFTELSLAISLPVGVHDVFMKADGVGTLSLTTSAWSTETSRSPGTSLVVLDGILVHSIDFQERYLGTIYVNGGNLVYDTQDRRTVWNVHNRVLRGMIVPPPFGASWEYTSTTWRQSGGVNIMRLYFIQGLSEDLVTVDSLTGFNNSPTGTSVRTGIGLDSTTTPIEEGTGFTGVSGTTGYGGAACTWTGYPSIGHHYVQQLERASGVSPSQVFHSEFTFISGEVFA